jgi:holo-[acyl-carrier protein] synthase
MQFGIDLVQINDFKKRLDNDFLPAKIFVADELKNNNINSLAGIFAAKEAFFKALGRKIDWLEVWVEKSSAGQPIMRTDFLQNKKISLSISHSSDYAVAIVAIE